MNQAVVRGRWNTRIGWKSVRLVVSALVAVAMLFAGGTIAQAFTDVPADRLDYAAITSLTVKGAVEGYPDGSFRPDSPASRAQFVKMVTAAMFLTPKHADNVPFEDVAQPGATGSPYPGGYITAAYTAGIVEGKCSAVFDPFGPLSRSQAMTIAVRTAERLQARDLQPLPNGYQGVFADVDDPNHGNNARLAEANSLLEGIDLRSWDPRATATRSEAAIIVWNLVGCFG